MSFDLVTTHTTGDTLTAADLESNFNRLRAVLNQGIANTDISASAAIKIESLANQYQTIFIPIIVEPAVYLGWATSVPALLPITNVTLPLLPNTTCYIDSVAMVCTDWGTQTTQFRLDFGYYEQDSGQSIPSWTTLQNIVPLTTLSDVSGGAYGDNMGDTRLLPVATNSILPTTRAKTLTSGTSLTIVPAIGLFLVVKDTTMLSVGGNECWAFGITLKVRLQP